VAAPGGEPFQVQGRPDGPEGDCNLYQAARGGEAAWLWEAAGESAGAGRLRREAEVLAGLDSPLFPRLLAHFECGGRAYLATGPLPGETLSDALASGELSLARTLSVLAQVAFGLTHLHAHGWAHLGLRPAAVLLGKPVRLTDFRYAARLGEKPAAPFHLAGYSAPELLQEAPADARADIYSVGAMLYHAIQGQPIRETGAELEVWDPPMPAAGVPQILNRTLGPPESRYATMDALHRDLVRLTRRYSPVASYSVVGKTTIGLEPTRTTNQDAYTFLVGAVESDEGPRPWAMVCVSDGMGGMAAGEVASDVAVKSVIADAAGFLGTAVSVSTVEQVRKVREWVHTANGKVCAALDRRGARGGCTLVCASLVNRRMAIGHVGDCRLYLLRDGEVTPLTRDHSVVMAMVLQGEIRLDEIRRHPDRSKVTRSLGDRDPLPDYIVDSLEPVTGSAVLELRHGDVLLLCSDGLWEPVLEAEMREAVTRHAPDLHAASTALLRLALERGGPDNATVVLLRVEETSASEEEKRDAEPGSETASGQPEVRDRRPPEAVRDAEADPGSGGGAGPAAPGPGFGD
jgi:protein phosphatase